MTGRAICLCGMLTAGGAVMAARPVAQWDVVPYQRVAGVFEAGVVAFHEKGLKVEFAVNGKPAFTAEAPVLNPRTKVWEYVFALDAAKCATGPISLTARAVTPEGEACELPALPLFADAGKSLGSPRTVWVDAKNGNDYAEGTAEAPLQTLRGAIAKVGDGGTVYLRPGRYTAVRLGGAAVRRYWTLVSSAPGVRREQVLIAGGRMGTDKLHFRSVVLYCSIELGGFGSVLLGENGRTSCWVEDCRMLNRKGNAARDARPFGGGLVAYVTGGSTERLGQGPDARLVRGHAVRGVSGVAFGTDTGLIVNCRVTGLAAVAGGDTACFLLSHETDPKWVHDLVVYNVVGTDCDAHGFYGEQIRDAAFVNVSFRAQKSEGALHTRSQYGGNLNNVLLAHLTVEGQPWNWHEGRPGKPGAFLPADVRMINCRFGAAMSLARPADGSKGLLLDHCAFASGRTFGVVPATGAGERGGVPLACVPADAEGTRWPEADARPCGAFAR